MDKDAELACVLEWLFRASKEIDSDYFQLPVAEQEDPEYRERVYCYELYHQWRSAWPKDFRFKLCGEIDKSGHRLIREQPKPDFLVHHPGQMTQNLLIVEVKPTNAALARMVEDLEKLTLFRRDYDYHAAYFWIYGLETARWPGFRGELLAKIKERARALPRPKKPVVDLKLISCVIHEKAGKQAVEVGWQ